MSCWLCYFPRSSSSEEYLINLKTSKVLIFEFINPHSFFFSVRHQMTRDHGTKIQYWNIESIIPLSTFHSNPIGNKTLKKFGRYCFLHLLLIDSTRYIFILAISELLENFMMQIISIVWKADLLICLLLLVTWTFNLKDGSKNTFNLEICVFLNSRFPSKHGKKWKCRRYHRYHYTLFFVLIQGNNIMAAF
jgi:hypothetical protein